jgi:beta-mannosidase
MQPKITKRKFLTTSAMAAAAVFAWEPLFSLAAPTTIRVPRRLSLDGGWQLSQAGKDEWIPATVPGGAYTDLLAAGKIPDPFYRDDEKTVQWVGDSDWIYRRSFKVPADVLKNDRILLRCEGLDTLATIKINGTEAGRADNMFRLWEFDVKPFLRTGDNSIEILFGSPATYMKQRDTDQAPDKWIKGRAWVRKEPCSYGWDWGPSLPTSGIWRHISLETFNQARIGDLLVRQNHADNNVSLDVVVNAEVLGKDTAPLKAKASVLLDDESVATAKFEIADGQGGAHLEITDPKLWWPAGMGGQPLYTVHVELFDADSHPIDSMSKRVGLRTLKAVLPRGDMPLHFEANGLPFFAKGANWIPADSFPTRVTPQDCRRYVADAAAVNMNILRFWGGGYYEDDAMFEACDEMGVCVWLDFKFACGAYPAFDGKFMENVKLEARDNLQRLRHHPCIAVWCGNNEISLSWWEGPTWGPNRMSTSDYDKLFKDLLGSQVQTFAPGANYVTGSPDCGDTHYWDVWHGNKLFDAYRTQNGFMSEFGYQSFPELKTIKSFTNEADRAGVLTPVMKWHQRSGVGNVDGNAEMVHMIHRYFNAPKDFETTLWLSQILQGYGIKIGAEYWRQTMPKSMGCVFWQYNDCWPGMSWSSVDYFGRWKALHYLARKFYAPILISGLEDAKDGTIDLFVTSDRLENHHGKLSWTLTDLEGNSLLTDSADLKIPARKSQKVRTLRLQDQIQKLGANGILTWLRLDVDGQTVSENMVSFALPKELKLADPQLTVTIEESPGGFSVTIKSKKPALWVWLGLEKADAKYADNFFHLLPEAPRIILVRPKQLLSKPDFAGELRVRSLFDTYS